MFCLSCVARAAGSGRAQVRVRIVARGEVGHTAVVEQKPPGTKKLVVLLCWGLRCCRELCTHRSLITVEMYSAF
jgi:hypothetical protein